MRELVVEAKIDNLDEVQAFIGAALGDCPPKTKNAIAISVDEIFNNIASYAYPHGAGTVTVRVKVDGVARIEFEDGGLAYNPLQIDDPDLSLGADERPIGGLGIFMVKNLMDSVEYARKDGHNLLVMQKAIG